MTLSSDTAAKAEIIAAMLIFGTIGIFVRFIPLPSGILALTRAILGSVFLICVMAVRRTHVTWSAVRKNLPALCFSGACIGINWILLFEAYRYTTVSTATLCYYMAPVFITLASPVVLRERLTPLRLVCVAAALCGMALISGISGTEGISYIGLLLGLGAAVLYACVVLTNKKLRGLGSFDTTVSQLVVAAVVLLPYTLLTEDLSAVSLEPLSIALLFVVGIVHTGIAYALYFSSMRSIRAQTAAILSYIDPVTAIILSALILNEKMTAAGIAGAVLILASTLISELCGQKQ